MISQPLPSTRAIRSSVADSARIRGSMLAQICGSVLQDLMQNRVNGRQFVLQPVLKLLDDELAVLFFLDQAFCDLPLLRDDRSIVLDAPYREAAHDQIDRQKRQSCEVDVPVAEIDGHAERAANEGCRDPDPEAAERGGKEYGRKIRGEEYVRPDQRKAPPRRGRQGHAECCKSDAEKRRWPGYSLPAPPKLLDQFHHGSHQPIGESKIRPSIAENKHFEAPKKPVGLQDPLALEAQAGNIDRVMLRNQFRTMVQSAIVN